MPTAKDVPDKIHVRNLESGDEIYREEDIALVILPPLITSDTKHVIVVTNRGDLVYPTNTILTGQKGDGVLKGDQMGAYAEPYPTRHVVEKIGLREVTWGEILEMIDRPEVKYGPDPQGRHTLQKGNLCVVVARDGAVITVLLRQTEQWTDLDARNRRGFLVERARKIFLEEFNREPTEKELDDRVKSLEAHG